MELAGPALSGRGTRPSTDPFQLKSFYAPRGRIPAKACTGPCGASEGKEAVGAPPQWHLPACDPGSGRTPHLLHSEPTTTPQPPNTSRAAAERGTRTHSSPPACATSVLLVSAPHQHPLGPAAHTDRGKWCFIGAKASPEIPPDAPAASPALPWACRTEALRLFIVPRLSPSC